MNALNIYGFSFLMKQILVVLFILTPLLVLSDESKSHYQELFEQASELYQKGEFKNAGDIYTEIVAADYISAPLFYNLGNTYFKTNKVPSAILYYEKAKRLAPQDEDIQFNLTMANQQIVDKVEPLPELFYEKWWKNLVHSASADTWGYITLILVFTGFILLALYIISSAVLFKKLFFILGLILLISSGITLTIASQQYQQLTSKDKAVVFAPSLTVKSSPDINSTDLFVIHEGIKVAIREEVGEWYRISLADGNEGWLRKDAVEII